MRQINLKKVLKQNYGCRISLIMSIIAPILGIIVFLSVLDVIPRFPLTQSMTMQTSIIFLIVCIGIALVGFFTIKSIVAKLKNIFSNGNLVKATITKISSSKHQVMIHYIFDFEGEKCTGNNNLSKQLSYKKKYTKDSEFDIYALKIGEGKIVSALDIYQ